MFLVHKDDKYRHPIVSALDEAPWTSETICYKNYRALWNKTGSIITTDPLSFASAFLLSSRSARIVFVSLEMYEYQIKIRDVKSFLRYWFFIILHHLALTKAETVVFPNRHRRLFYILKGINFKRTPLVVENVPSRQRMDILLNGPKESNLAGFNSLFLNQKVDRFILYAGSLSKERRIRELIEIFKHKNDHCLIVAGNDIERIFGDTSYPNVVYIGELEPKITLALLKKCNAQIGLYSTDTLNSRWAAPIKVYESLVAGVPIILNDELAKVFRKYQGVIGLSEFDLGGILESPVINEIRFDSYAELFKDVVFSTH